MSKDGSNSSLPLSTFHLFNSGVMFYPDLFETVESVACGKSIRLLTLLGKYRSQLMCLAISTKFLITKVFLSQE